AYGVQEWIGYVGVTKIVGSYFNVMGLPVERVWEEIRRAKEDDIA
ncbi:MAG: Maf family protein, partial [Paludibacteraceae bacterium]